MADSLRNFKIGKTKILGPGCDFMNMFDACREFLSFSSQSRCEADFRLGGTSLELYIECLAGMISRLGPAMLVANIWPTEKDLAKQLFVIWIARAVFCGAGAWIRFLATFQSMRSYRASSAVVESFHARDMQAHL